MVHVPTLLYPGVRVIALYRPIYVGSPFNRDQPTLSSVIGPWVLGIHRDANSRLGGAQFAFAGNVLQ